LRADRSTGRILALCIALATFLLAFLVRIANFPTAFVNGVPQFPPFDDLYHAKRIAYSATHPFRVLSFDPNRGTSGSFCAWPPLYDMLAGAASRALGGTTPVGALARAAWFPPLVSSLVAAAIAAWMTRRFGAPTGLIAGAGVALSIYYFDTSRLGTIDHHFLEFPLTLAILAAVVLVSGAGGKTAFRHGAILGLALVCALLVQPALIVAAAAALFGILMLERSRVMARAAGGVGFAIASAVLLVYRGLQPPGYPENQWYLGTPHAAALLGAAAACAAQLWALQKGVPPWRSGVVALGIGVLTILAIPNAAPAILGGSEFFAGDPWFRSIAEFQPLFVGPESQWLLDLCLLGGGALLAIAMPFNARWRRGSRRPVALFAIGYLLAALSSMRFLAVTAPLLAVSGALFFSDLERAGRKRLAWAAGGLLLLPSMLSVGRALRPAVTIKPEGLPMVRAVSALVRPSAPPGKVLARGTWGHLINVVANRPVLLDNFGVFDSRTKFENATGILFVSKEKAVADFCSWHGVRFVLLENPRLYSATCAKLGGLPLSAFEQLAGTDLVPTRLMTATFWWRAYFEGGGRRPDLGPAGEAFRFFRLVGVERDPSPEAAAWAVQIWELVERPESAGRTN
jgi:asparagine N-glycosylation enzyme membrane subunit Stt3